MTFDSSTGLEISGIFQEMFMENKGNFSTDRQNQLQLIPNDL